MTPPGIPAASTTQGLRSIDIDRIRPNDSQPRQDFDRDALEDLARSVRKQGVLQPIIVRPDAGDGKYELIAGERRWRAAQMAGLLKVPAIVKDVEDRRMLEIALIENLQREQLNPIEEATAYQILMDDLGLTQQEVADRVGKPRATIANLLRLLSLVPKVQELVREGSLSTGHAKALAAVGLPKSQASLAQRVVTQQLSVRDTERLVSKHNAPPPAASGPTVTKSVDRDPNVAAAEESLQAQLGAKVRIVPSGKKAGRMELHYHDGEELRRLYDIVMAGARRGAGSGGKIIAD